MHASASGLPQYLERSPEVRDRVSAGRPQVRSAACEADSTSDPSPVCPHRALRLPFGNTDGQHDFDRSIARVDAKKHPAGAG
jgi:hypothetical protein